jgi:ferrous iron transport protein B
MTLKELNIGEKAVITKVKGRGAFRKRMVEMGFIVGQVIESIKKAPFQDPVEYKLMDYEVSLRNSEAELIEIVSETEVKKNNPAKFNGTLDTKVLKKSARKKERIINIALVGNPNSGKTTLFNFASGSKERVGNYGGVTVEAKEAKFKVGDYVFNIVDLPGTYSITAYSPEELFVRDHIINNVPDVVVNVVDSSNLERNLYLTTQLIDMDIKVVVALNMYDEFSKKGDSLDFKHLGDMLGIPFVPTVSSRGKGIKQLFDKIIDVYEDKDENVRHIHINYGLSVENSINQIQDEIYKYCNRGLTDRYSSRFLAIKLIEKDKEVRELIQSECKNKDNILKIVDNRINLIEKDYKDDSETLITDSKYGFIEGALRETFKQAERTKVSKSRIIDKVITHKYLGIPIFLFFIWLTFFVTFNLGDYPMGWIEAGVSVLGNFLTDILPSGMFRDLLIDGVIGGVGGVLVFLPNIVLLYMFISLMEDSGYMARAVFIMDKAMHKIGLHGKSFIPLLMGFGCNVPAIMSSRIIESKRDRMITILINPFMSCSARLTVYVLLISAFFVEYRSLILFSLYLFGVLLAIITAFLLRKTFFKTKDIPFVMELPPYRIPTLKTILRHMWFRAQIYLKKVGGIILVASVIIWFLGYFPRNNDIMADYNQRIDSVKTHYTNIPINERANDWEARMSAEVKHLNSHKNNELQEKSLIGYIGRFIHPVMEPLGFDWKMSISLLTGVTAKEVVVGTLGVLYEAEGEEDDEINTSLISRIQEQTYLKGPKQGEKVFTPVVAISFMLFILIYFPCIGVIAAIKKESGGWKWPIFEAVYSTVLAWLMAFLAYNIGIML